MQEIEQLFWGRKAQSSWLGSLGSLFIVVCCPLWISTNWIGLEYFDGSIAAEISAFFHQGPTAFVQNYFPRGSWDASVGYVAWLVFQALLFIILPGPTSTGQLTPAGNLLTYKTNGLLAWLVTHVLFLTLGFTGLLDMAIIAKNFEGLWVAMNVYGFVLAGFALVKAHVAPTHPNDCKFSGSLIFDYFVGIELNPRIGNFDLKLFHNGRPGIVAWTLIDLSYMAYQYQEFGRISNSMLIANLLHFIYVVDFFYNEDWYLRTIDMTHDHYGYYLGWGSMAALPTVYTIQVQYLARYPVDLTLLEVAIILTIGLGGYAIFRGANHQKDIVRSTNGQCNVWGKKAEYIRCKYKTEDGKTHESILLCSGWWGFSRHANYLGDLMQAFAMGATCGFTTFIPWGYTFFLLSLLINRVPRDEARCLRKYGHFWRQYCDKVQWRLLPGVL